MTDQQFHDDKLIPIVDSLINDTGEVVENIEKRLRYLAETILLHLGDELPGRWIPVNEELPELRFGVCSRVVLCAYKDCAQSGYGNLIEACVWWGDSWQFVSSRHGKIKLSDIGCAVTHWRPLPKSPSMENLS